MQNQTERQKNAGRFTGFAETYDQARPSVPPYTIRVICNYLGKIPNLVVDLGCGTGLSTAAWQGHCRAAVGIEPSFDMLRLAKQKEGAQLRFAQGYGNQTGLGKECADVVMCSQSFHWMEPASTLREVDRILRPGGVFATVDCDWPPVTQWRVERQYMQLYGKVKRLEKELPDVQNTFVRYDKERHLANIKSSRIFCYCREVVFSSSFPFTAERLINLLLSQGSLQTVLKLHPERIRQDIEQFQSKIRVLFGDKTLDLNFCYRMRIGIKASDGADSAAGSVATAGTPDCAF